ncbi:hypothetical protein [Paenibacillus harenae]|uniref:hypothetical protein n=1 Tax=Paenibacillus harenae TaxID=306543 RepID=UPI000407C582|nr:hypothetical protein [Paenibacillus harenae]
MQLVEANVRWATEWQGLTCAVVEVVTDDPEAKHAIVYFSLSDDNDFDMQAVVQNHAAADTDWFDNNMHQAFEDVTVDLFQNVNMKTNWGAREVFKEEVLSFGRVREELAELLRNGAE